MLIPSFRLMRPYNYQALYANMFCDDISSGFMPTGGRSSRRPDLDISVQGDDSASGLRLLSSLSDQSQANVERTICDAFNSIAQDIAHHGYATYEISRDEDLVRLTHIDATSIFRLPLITIQIIPTTQQVQFGKRILVCPNSKLWRLSIPASLGGEKGHAKTIRTLYKFKTDPAPEFATAAMMAGIPSYFDFDAYSVNQASYLNKATSRWSWNRRDYTDQLGTEFYQTYKRVQFRLAQALLRECIHADINLLFRRLDFKCKLQISGVPTVAHITAILQRLNEGAIDFGNAVEEASV